MAAQSFAEELVDYLVTNASPTLKGSDIFYSFLPDVTTSPVVCVRETGGMAPELTTPRADPTMQIMVRADTWLSARQVSAEIYNLLHQRNHTAFEHNYVVYCEAFALPQDLGPDDRGRHTVSCNYHFKTYATVGGGDETDPDHTDIQD